MGKKEKQQLLDRIKADILEQNICPNLAQTATQLVMGDGNPDSDIVFIGEAPGKNEDEQGLPFVGAAGKFLDEMLESIDLKRDDIYITNIVKYRPPNNRDPSPEEKQAFMPFLYRQLTVIDPKLVITLGRHSMSVFLPDMKISQVHGRAFRKKAILVAEHPAVNGDGAEGVRGGAENRTESYKPYDEGDSQATTKQSDASSTGISGFAGKQGERSIVILPLYHPAAALYNGGMRETLLEDFARIPIILKKI